LNVVSTPKHRLTGILKKRPAFRHPNIFSS